MKFFNLLNICNKILLIFSFPLRYCRATASTARNFAKESPVCQPPPSENTPNLFSLFFATFCYTYILYCILYCSDNSDKGAESMAFNFFTFGGSQFWEDVLFYQKWRIQRHWLTKKYRLLDNWDIRRESGSFDKCRRALEKYIGIFQISTPNSNAVLMLHGLGGNKNEFKKMIAMAESLKLTAIAVNYPSTRKNFNAHIRQLEALLSGLTGIKELSFIGEGLGALLLRQLLASDSLQAKKIKPGRVIQINAPNRGCLLWEKLAKCKPALFILGPTIQYGTTRKAAEIPMFASGTNPGVINTHNRVTVFLQRALPQSLRFIFRRSADSYLPDMGDIAEIDTWHFNPLADKKVVDACKCFLLTGKFRSGGAKKKR